MDFTTLFPSRERAWIIRVESAAGNKRKDTYKKLLNEPVDMMARLYVLGKLLTPRNTKTSYAKQTMAIDLLNHPLFETQDRIDGEEFISNAISASMLDVIPVLHAKGFRMKLRNHHINQMVAHLCHGRWSHPDLLAPDILDTGATLLAAFGYSLFCNPNTLREEFVRKLVSLPGGSEQWVRDLHQGYLDACKEGKLQDSRMHRSQLVSSLAVFHGRGWLRQENLETFIKRKAYIDTDWLTFARTLMHEVVVHELQQATPKPVAHTHTRRI